ncbi:CDP-alcohol phosphatidyltransferase family protein [Candidatus Woesearchaeota archaeon]|nr:CDP-alcohol phosphatidyltransferase family protein [Candidatus Woesearchaeota archaeon]
MPKKFKFTIPDYITSIRFVATPIIFALILTRHAHIAFLVYVAAALTDAVDGIFARIFKQKSEFGGMFDALADRCLGFFTLLALLMMDVLSLFAIIILICYAAIELGMGAWITIKYKKFYLYFVHRNSIRYFAVALFTLIGGYVLNWNTSISIANIMLVISIPFAIYVIIDYVKYILTHKKWR